MKLVLQAAKARVLLAGAFLLMAGAAGAEEGGSGHYMPGSMASFIDSVPPAPTFLMRLNLLNYSGSIDADKRLPIGGVVAAGVKASIQGVGLTMAWRPEMEMPAGWSYAMSATVPLLHAKVTASASTASGARVVALSDTESGLGDLVLQPLMLNYQISPDLGTNFRVTVYAPTGDYTVGKLANTGKNFWTVEPTLAFVYFGKKDGIEAALFTGFDFNTKNDDTQYKSGTQFHLDGTLAQHFPLDGGLAGVGLSGYYYKQITADSGSGATLGDFKAKTIGLGPVASYITKVGGHDVSAELKWLHEFDTTNRLQGDTVFFKLLAKF